MILSDMVHETYLKEIDPILYNHLMNELQIEPQVYIIRWTRLLFAREFGFETLLEVWSSLFRTHLRLVPFLCISMLVKLRERLLVSDLHEALENLMKFPNVIGYEKVMEFAFHLLNTPLKEILREMPQLPPVKKLEMTETKESPVKSNTSTLNAIRYGVSLVGNAFTSNSDERLSRRERTVSLVDLETLENCLLKMRDVQDLVDAKELAEICLRQIRKLK